MDAFWIGVASSMAATCLAAILSAYLPSRARSLALSLLAPLSGLGIDRVYKDEKNASADMLRDAASSAAIRILSIRGFRITDEERPLNKLLGRDFNYDELEIMLADPTSPAVQKRSKDFTHTSLVYPADQMYAQDVAKSINVLIGASAFNSRIHVRLHGQCDSFRLFITDQSVYLSFFPKGRSASTSPVFRVKHGTLLFNALLAHYNWVRQHDSHPQVDTLGSTERAS